MCESSQIRVMIVHPPKPGAGTATECLSSRSYMQEVWEPRASRAVKNVIGPRVIRSRDIGEFYPWAICMSGSAQAAINNKRESRFANALGRSIENTDRRTSG
jgi:hypothetical protein